MSGGVSEELFPISFSKLLNELVFAEGLFPISFARLLDDCVFLGGASFINWGILIEAGGYFIKYDSPNSQNVKFSKYGG